MTTTPELDAALRAGQSAAAAAEDDHDAAVDLAMLVALRSLGRRPTSATLSVVRQAVEDVLNAMIEPGATTTLWELSDKAASAALTAYWTHILGETK